MSQQFTCQLKTLSEVIEENAVEQIDLLKIDVEKSELEVLRGIKEEHWQKIKQIVVEVHDRDGRLDRVIQLLEGHGYKLIVAQEPELSKTGLYNIYARRKLRERSPTDKVISPTKPRWYSENALIKELRHYLKEKLPEYAIASAFVVLSTLPLTANGKVDRNALPRPKADIQHRLVPPRTQTEEIIAGIWSEVLGIEQVSIYDNFFDLGGHSLLATQVTTRLRDRAGIELPLRDLFAQHTLASLAQTIEKMRLALEQLQSAPAKELGDREEFEL